MQTRRLPVLAERDRALKDALDSVRARCDTEARRRSDPVEYVHRYEDPHDRELVALLASALAFGNVKALRAKIEEALSRMGPGVAVAADDPVSLKASLRGFKHRLFLGEDLARLLIGARRVQRAHGSLGEALRGMLANKGDLREALVEWTGLIRREGGLDKPSRRRGPAHILADPSKGSAVKRLLLLLRWMVRPADGIDLGLWPLPPSALVIPVDTHIHKLSRNLGLSTRKDVSWRTAAEITSALRRFDPDDPVKYDFSLCHMGMLQRCPSRKDPVRCEGCGVMSVCRHWQPRPPRNKPARARS
ncbi:MAG: TIGR02757 family protein [Polyangiaceae bacterium]